MKNTLILLTGLLLVACGSKKTEKNPFPANNEAIAVKVADIQSLENGKIIQATGLVTTENEARYSFKIGGIIESMSVEEGQHFRRGQLLATLKITEINSQLQQAQLGYEKAQRDFTRASNLYNDSVATLEQFQNAKTAMDIAKKNIDVVSFNQNYAAIYALADGFVTKQMAHVGEVVGAGTPIFTINENNGNKDWVLKVGVTDKQWANIQENQQAQVTLDAFPDKTFQATVFRKSQAADQTSGSFQIELKLQLDSEKLAVGMFGKAMIVPTVKTNQVAIPYDALIEAEGNRGYVFTPIENTKVKKIPVQIASFDKNQVFVEKGLEGVGQVVVSNSAFLNEKSAIKIIK